MLVPGPTLEVRGGGKYNLDDFVMKINILTIYFIKKYKIY